MEFVLLLLVVVLGSILAVVVVQWLEAKNRLARYSGITDLEKHKTSLVRQGEAAKHQAAELKKAAAQWEEKLEILKRDLESVEESLDLQSFGVYRAHYGFDTSSEYQARLVVVRDAQKVMIRDKVAAVCTIEWKVENSRVEGRKMENQQIKLMLRAFNGECDAAIGKVKYNNVTKLETRIRKSFEAINKLGQTKRIHITEKYLGLKLDELHLVHEHREKVQEEKEEQQRIKEEMREEAKAQKEAEKEQKDAERLEELKLQALEQARKDFQESVGAHAEKLRVQVEKLELELKDAIDRKAKAIARAQLTKSGHVYVISNLGSFGEGIYKIGMTRRLEPLLRVKELGDASVPFLFDVHAMIYSENAPELERALHDAFGGRRVNRVNMRKEFFRVSLAEIRETVAKHHGVVTFVKEADAEEYRKTIALIEEERSARASSAAA